MCVPCNRLFGLHMMALQWLGSLSTHKDTPPPKGSITLPPCSMVRSSSCKASPVASSCLSLSYHSVEAFLSSKLRCQAQNKRHRMKGTTCIVIECMAITVLLHILCQEMCKHVCTHCCAASWLYLRKTQRSATDPEQAHIGNGDLALPQEALRSCA